VNPPRPSEWYSQAPPRGGTPEMRSPSREQSESGCEPASETVCFRVCFPRRFSHGVHANSESARARTHARTYNARASVKCCPVESECRSSHRITSHRIASHRIATTPGPSPSHAPFLPFTCLHIRLLEGENPSNSVSLFVWSPVGSPHRRFGAFQSQPYLWSFEMSALGGRLLGNILRTDRRSLDLISRSLHEMNACRQWSVDTLCICVSPVFGSPSISTKRKFMKSIASEAHSRDHSATYIHTYIHTCMHACIQSWYKHAAYNIFERNIALYAYVSNEVVREVSTKKRIKNTKTTRADPSSSSLRSSNK